MSSTFKDNREPINSQKKRKTHRQSITWDNNDALSLIQKLDNRINVGSCGLAFKLHGLSSTGGLGSISTEDDTNNVSIHCITHNLGKGSATASDESSNGRKEGHIKHKALSTQCPTGITIQYRDHNGHIGSTDRCSHVPSQGATGCQGATESGKSCSHLRSAHYDSSSSKSGGAKTRVDAVTCRMLHGSRIEAAIKLAKGN